MERTRGQVPARGQRQEQTTGHRVYAASPAASPGPAAKTTHQEVGGHRPGQGGEAREGQAGQQEEFQQGRGGGGGAPTKKPEILKIMYSNIQSIQSKLYELNVQAVELNPDIILLTETW